MIHYYTVNTCFIHFKQYVFLVFKEIIDFTLPRVNKMIKTGTNKQLIQFTPIDATEKALNANPSDGSLSESIPHKLSIQRQSDTYNGISYFNNNRSKQVTIH